MRVLIAEDEPDIWRTYKIALEYRNHEVLIAENGHQCLAIYRQELFDRTSTKNPAMSAASQLISANLASTSSSSSSRSSSSLNKDPSSIEDDYSPSASVSPFDVVVLDYSMPGKDGIGVAKEILALNPQHRIIFASAYVKDTLEVAVKELRQVVELMQKPFDAEVLVDMIEDTEIREGIKKLMNNLRLPSQGNDIQPLLEQVTDLFEGLRKIQKCRTF